MGVHGLWQVLDSVGHPVKVEALEGKRLGVDASVWLYKFLMGMRDKGPNLDTHKLGLFNRCSKLLFYKIKPIFVFDGPAPMLKRKTLERRQNTRNKMLIKAKDATMKLLTKQLREQYPGAQIDDILIKLPELKSYNLAAAEKLTDEDKKLFELPPETIQLQNSESESSDEDEDIKSKPEPAGMVKREDFVSDEDSDMERDLFSTRQHPPVDIDSKDFNSLPPEIRYEILMDVKEKRRKVRRCYDLPEDPGNFSNFQLERLKARRSVQEKIEQCEKDICSMYTGYTGSVEGKSIQSYRVQSDSRSTMLYMTKSDVCRQDILSSKVEKPKIETSGDDCGQSVPSTSQPDETKALFDTDTMVYDITSESESEETELELENDKHSPSSTSDSETEENEPESRSENTQNQVELSDAESEEIKLDPEPEETCTSPKTQSHNLHASPIQNDREENSFNLTRGTIEIDLSPPEVAKLQPETSPVSVGESDESDLEEVVADKKEAATVNTTVLVSDEETEPEQDVITSTSSHEPSLQVNPEIPVESLTKHQDKVPSDSKAEARSEEAGPGRDDKSIERPNSQSLTKETNQGNASSAKSDTDTQLNLTTSRSQVPKVEQRMVEDCKELLRLFGIPYIVAAGEAEAQCALLESLNLTDGTITDDSDAWLFGAKNVYRYFFSDDKYVMHTKMADIDYHLRLTRENLICFAMLVGSDYTDGIVNVGSVTALEILSEFPGPGMEPLIEFKRWREQIAQEKVKKVNNKVRAKLLKYKLPEEFPSRAVFDGYMRPVADDSTEKFSWGTPELDELREYARRNFGWDTKKIDEKLLPVMKKLSERSTQSRIDSFFFKTASNQNPELFRSKRVNEALNKLATKKGPSQESQEDGCVAEQDSVVILSPHNDTVVILTEDEDDDAAGSSNNRDADTKVPKKRAARAAASRAAAATRSKAKKKPATSREGGKRRKTRA